MSHGGFCFTDSTAAVTAYGVYYKIQQFVFFAAFGLNNAIIPIVSFNYGMRNKQRVKEGIFQALGCGVQSLIISLLRLIVIALPLAWLFTKIPNSENVIWWVFPIAEGFALIVAVFIMKKINKDKVKELA